MTITLEEILRDGITQEQWDRLSEDEQSQLFIEAAEGGHPKIINSFLDLTSDAGQKQRMIKYNDAIALHWVAAKGHLDVLNRLLEIIPDEKQKQRIIHAHRYELLFFVVKESGDLRVLNRLLELTPEIYKKERMIHYSDELAFKEAVKKRDLVVLNFLLEKTPDLERRGAIIADLSKRVAVKGDLVVLNFLLEKTPDPMRREAIISELKLIGREDDDLDREYANLNLEDANRFFLVTSSKESSVSPEEIEYLLNEETKQLIQLRKDLMIKFGDESPVPNRVIVSLIKCHYALTEVDSEDLDLTEFGLNGDQSRDAWEVMTEFFEKIRITCADEELDKDGFVVGFSSEALAEVQRPEVVATKATAETLGARSKQRKECSIM